MIDLKKQYLKEILFDNDLSYSFIVVLELMFLSMYDSKIDIMYIMTSFIIAIVLILIGYKLISSRKLIERDYKKELIIVILLFPIVFLFTNFIFKSNNENQYQYYVTILLTGITFVLTFMYILTLVLRLYKVSRHRYRPIGFDPEFSDEVNKEYQLNQLFLITTKHSYFFYSKYNGFYFNLKNVYRNKEEFDKDIKFCKIETILKNKIVSSLDELNNEDLIIAQMVEL